MNERRETVSQRILMARLQREAARDTREALDAGVVALVVTRKPDQGKPKLGRQAASES